MSAAHNTNTTTNINTQTATLPISTPTNAEALPVILSSADLSAMSPTALTTHLAQLQSSLLAARRSRSFLNQHVEQQQQLTAQLQAENAQTEAHVHNIHSQLERLAETHRHDIILYTQKVTHFDYAQQQQRDSLQQHSSHQQSNAALSQANIVQTLQQTYANLQQQLITQSLSDEENIRKTRENNKKEVHKLRENFTRQYQELQHHYMEKLQHQQQDTELVCHMELHEIEERKNKHLMDLHVQQEKNFMELKTYYQTLTQDNVLLIKELQNELMELKKSQERKEKSILALEQKNIEIHEPLAQTNATVTALTEKLQKYEKNKQSLLVMQKQVHNKMKQLLQSKQQYTQLYQEYQLLLEQQQQIQLRTNEKHKKLLTKQQEVKHYASLSAMHDKLLDIFEVKKTQFQSVLQASNLPPSLLVQLTEKLDFLLNEKNKILEGLVYEREKYKKMYDDLYRVMEAKMKQMGIERKGETIRGGMSSSSGRSNLAATRKLIQQQQQEELCLHGKQTQPANLIVR